MDVDDDDDDDDDETSSKSRKSRNGQKMTWQCILKFCCDRGQLVKLYKLSNRYVQHQQKINEYRIWTVNHFKQWSIQSLVMNRGHRAFKPLSDLLG